MEIKKIEVIFSIIIVAAMIVIGFIISGNIRMRLLESYQEYDSAVQLVSEEEFLYGMETDIGKAFVYGTLKTLDPVTFPEIGGEYSYIKRESQEYRRHSKPVTRTYRDTNGHTRTKTEIEYYWTWDTMHTDYKIATRISFLNVEFAYDKISFPMSSHITTLDTGFHKRNVYYGTGTEYTGTIFTTLKEDTISETSFYENLTIDETIENLESGYELVFFWIAWILFTILVVAGFYYLENRWLD